MLEVHNAGPEGRVPAPRRMRKALAIVWGAFRNGTDFDLDWGAEA